MRALVSILMVCFVVTAIQASEGPVCRKVNGSFGWVLTNGCFTPDANCSDKDVVCAAIGSRAEGWYAREDMPMYDSHNGTESLRCDSEYRQELLGLSYRSYFCKDEYVFDSDYQLLEYHQNCQFPKAE